MKASPSSRRLGLFPSGILLLFKWLQDTFHSFLFRLLPMILSNHEFTIMKTRSKIRRLSKKRVVIHSFHMTLRRKTKRRIRKVTSDFIMAGKCPNKCIGCCSFERKENKVCPNKSLRKITSFLKMPPVPEEAKCWLKRQNEFVLPKSLRTRVHILREKQTLQSQLQPDMIATCKNDDVSSPYLPYERFVRWRDPHLCVFVDCGRYFENSLHVLDHYKQVHLPKLREEQLRRTQRASLENEIVTFTSPADIPTL